MQGFAYSHGHQAGCTNFSLLHNLNENSRIPRQSALALPSTSNFHIFVYEVEVWTVVFKILYPLWKANINRLRWGRYHKRSSYKHCNFFRLCDNCWALVIEYHIMHISVPRLQWCATLMTASVLPVWEARALQCLFPNNDVASSLSHISGSGLNHWLVIHPIFKYTKLFSQAISEKSLFSIFKLLFLLLEIQRPWERMWLFWYPHS